MSVSPKSNPPRFVQEINKTSLAKSSQDTDSEDLLGKWFARTGKRSEIFLCTKFGVKPNPGGPVVISSDPAYVKEACERSLRRLGVSKIDLYYCHRVDLKTPIEKTIQAMVELKK